MRLRGVGTGETQEQFWQIPASLLGDRGGCAAVFELRELDRQTLEAAFAFFSLAEPELEIAEVSGEVSKQGGVDAGSKPPHFLRNCFGCSRSVA